jgi:glycogen operon protein
MMLGGDELGRTQQGNNNAYCQDNEISWVDWSRPDTQLQDFASRLVSFRKQHPVFRRRRFLAGAEASELRWFTPGGTEMTDGDWSDASALAIALYLNGSDDPDRAADGTPLLDDDFLVLVNAWWEPLEFVLPSTRERAAWHVEVDTYDLTPATGSAAAVRDAGDRVAVGPRSLAVLCSPRAA